jgi:endo-1,4-beta-xylanase
MHFSNIVAGLALISSAAAVPPPPHAPAGPSCPPPAPAPPAPPAPPAQGYPAHPAPPKPSGGPGGPKPPAGGKNDTLYQAIVKRGRSYIGTAVTLRNETKELDIIKTEFNSMTPENAMKWESTEPSQGNFTFADGDRHANFAKDNGLQLRCHTLVWHSQLPTWVSQGGFDNATLIQVMEDHIKALATRWADNCDQWDVVNEGMFHVTER